MTRSFPANDGASGLASQIALNAKLHNTSELEKSGRTMNSGLVLTSVVDNVISVLSIVLNQCHFQNETHLNFPS